MIINAFPIIEPLSIIQILIDFLTFSLIFLNFFAIPLEISFQNFESSKHSTFLSLVKCLNYLLLLQILSKFRSTYYENGILIIDSHLIIRNYIMKFFVIDIIAFIFLVCSNDNKLLKLIFLLKLHDFINLMKKYLDLLFFTDLFEKNMKIMIFLINFFLLAHFFSCFWFLIANSDTSEENWLKKYKIQDYNNINIDDPLKLYLISFYWIISLLSFKPDFERIGPYNTSEFVFCIFLQIFSIFFIFYSFHSLKNLFQGYDCHGKALESLKRIGKFKGITKLGNDKILKFFRYYDENVLETNILKKMNLQLKNKLISDEFFLLLNRIPFFKNNFSRDFLRKMAASVTIVQFTPEQQIFEVKFLFFQEKNL